MGGRALITNIGAFVKNALGIAPVSATAGSTNGALVIDRRDYLSCKLSVVTGAVSGAPTTTSVTATLQDSDDGSTGWTDVADATTTAATAANSEGHVDVDLSGVKRYIRVNRTVTFTGGTSPSVMVGAVVTLGGAVNIPA
jgi:hypothetical protein